MDKKFNGIDKSTKEIFCNILLKYDVETVKQILHKHSGRYDQPILELISYALLEVYADEDPLKIVNDALTTSKLGGLILKEDELNLSLFNGNTFCIFVFIYSML